MNQSGDLRMLRKIKKLIFKDNDEVMDNFRFTFEEILQLDHPNLSQIFDFRED
jgi:hypothetical protein